MKVKAIVFTSVLLFAVPIQPAFPAEPNEPGLLKQIMADTGEKIKGVFEAIPKIKNFIITSLGRDNPNTKFEIGQETYYMRYEEPDTMENVGMMYGLHMAVSYRVASPVLFKSMKQNLGDGRAYTKLKLEARWARGEVDYDSSSTGSIDGITDESTEIRGLICYEIVFSDQTTLTPYSGFGYRSLTDDNRGRYSSTGHWGYLRESKYFYIPVGFELSQNIKERWVLRLKGEYDFFLEGKQESHMEDGGATMLSETDGKYYVLDTLKNAQDIGMGIRGSIRLERQSDRFDFFLEPYARYWHIKDSDHVQLTSEGGSILWYHDSGLTIPYMAYEPDNNTLEYGLILGLNF
ncbi:MAG TPA: hypothetical protein PLB05_11690 [Candidatus Omnitrophota bacterium]|nr:hypothetical protein [Candidatus Omnitrophota bacterium]HPN57365.1 hypothetical protein [Candidatus Omnitrophota bacterium]